MGRRPQPNRRRGLLRATAAVIGLIILLIIVVTVVSSLTAPAVKAPTVPPTVGPISRTPVGITPVARTPTTHPATPRSRTPTTPGSPKPVPSATAGAKHKSLAVGPIILDDRAASRGYAPIRRSIRMISPAVNPGSGATAYFAYPGSAYQHVPLLVRQGVAVERVGYGDRFVRPVWSLDGQHLLYIHVTATSGIPGATWTLMQWTRRDDVSRPIVHASALALTPLGWRRGHILYMIAQPTTSTVYMEQAGRSSRIGVVLAQPLVNMSLSPNGRYVAFGAPANCGACTLDIYDLSKQTVWVGPTGMPNDSTLAWTRGDLLVGDVRGRLAVINPHEPLVTYVPLPEGVPLRWSNIMRAVLGHRRVSLVDTVTGRRYVDYGATR